MMSQPHGRELALCAALLALSCAGRDISLGEGRVRTTDGPAPLDFEEPQLVPGLPGEDEKDDDPALTPDLLTLYFNAQRTGGQGKEDIWFAERETRDAPFSPPTPESALNSEARETGIALSPDGLSLWFSSDRDGGAGGLDIYLATRATVRAPWSVARVPELSSDDDDLVSSVADGERTLFLARRDDEDDDYDLYVAVRLDRASAFSAPEPLDALNTDDEESDAVLLEASNNLVFTRDEQLVFAAGYPNPSGEIVPLSTLNSDDDDRDAWFSADGSYVMFSSNRSGTYRLYEARLAP
jgi:hypothetical protein